MNTFEEKVAVTTGEGLMAEDIETIQVNLGYLCNQECAHCHVSASPRRVEMMGMHTMQEVLKAADHARPALIDLTGGAPELNPHFREFIRMLSGAGHEVQVRTNLTALMEPGFDDLPGFLRDSRVSLVGSMPCYLEENVRAQRGPGVYEKSVAAIRALNALDYGMDGGLRLSLVYNPGGDYLPPDQKALEADYRRELALRAGISFTSLITITNMPIGRFEKKMRTIEKEESYLRLLTESFNPATLEGLMCRHQVSVGWDGALYDCDFNLALGLPVEMGVPGHIACFDGEALSRRRIVTGGHCFGCTAGRGSSCKGAIA
ncbi:MAG: arsenosugar biosynthesis radical SAM (seleno)protein ArsS [Nitrospirota bacterium]